MKRRSSKVKKHHLTLIHAFDDDAVIAGRERWGWKFWNGNLY